MINSLKCIECDSPAEYIYKGNSLCSEHLKFKSTNGSIYEAQYYSLLANYKGNESTLKYFWARIESQYPAFHFKSKCTFLESVNRIVDRESIQSKNIDLALNVAIKRKNYNIGGIIKTMQSLQLKDDNQMSEYNSNDDILKQIVRNS